MKIKYLLASFCIVLQSSSHVDASNDVSTPEKGKLVAPIEYASVTEKARRAGPVSVRVITSISPPEVKAPDWSNCPEYYESALENGWSESDWEKVDYIIWRESRCQTTAHNKDDPATGSRGLMQINGFWCRGSRYYPNGYLQDKGVLDTCEDLFVPEVNLSAALVIYNYAEETNGCGWGPWSTRNTRWC